MEADSRWISAIRSCKLIINEAAAIKSGAKRGCHAKNWFGARSMKSEAAVVENKKAEPGRSVDAGEVRVALASLVRMVQLLGAEMLVGKYREDIDVFESCVRAKLFAHVEGVAPDAT